MSDDSTTYKVYTCNGRDNLWVSTILYNPHHSTHYSTLHLYNLYSIPSVLYPHHSTIKLQFSTPPPLLHPTVHYTPLYSTLYSTPQSTQYSALPLQYNTNYSTVHPIAIYTLQYSTPPVLYTLQYATPSNSTLPPPTVLYTLQYSTPSNSTLPLQYYANYGTLAAASALHLTVFYPHSTLHPTTVSMHAPHSRMFLELICSILDYNRHLDIVHGIMRVILCISVFVTSSLSALQFVTLSMRTHDNR